MKVILLQNIKGLGQIGDAKNVSDGYARNFLLPRDLARAASQDALKQAETLKKKQAVLLSEQKKEALKMAEKLEGMEIKMSADASGEGHLYGSIGPKQIVQELKRHKLNLSEDQVELDKHIKTIGEHEIVLKLHPEVRTKIKVLVN